MHDHDGRAWITLDGEEILNMVHIWKWLYEVKKRAALKAGETDLWKWQNYEEYKEEAEKELENDSYFTQTHLGSAMHDYQSLSAEEILTSENPIIRAIGMLDRRIGVRRLKKIHVKSEHPLVVATYVFRCKAEGIAIENERPGTGMDGP
jgi:hypothetical protein